MGPPRVEPDLAAKVFAPKEGIPPVLTTPTATPRIVAITPEAGREAEPVPP